MRAEAGRHSAALRNLGEKKFLIDGRSALSRRLHDLAECFASQLGGWAALSDTMTANIRGAAELTALAESISFNFALNRLDFRNRRK